MTDHAAELAERWRPSSPEHSLPTPEHSRPYADNHMEQAPTAHTSATRLSDEAWNTMKASCEPSTGSKIAEMAFYGGDFAMVGLGIGMRISPRAGAIGFALGLANGIGVGHLRSKSDELDCLNKHMSGK